MDFLPLFHNLKGRTVLVVGGGEIALRKARLLSEAGAVLRVVAPEIAAELNELVAESGGQTLHRGYFHSDLSGCVLAIAATDDEPLNAQVSEDAKALGMPVNVVDSPQLCTVIFPAIVDRSPLMIAVSSGGDAPVLARLMRARIETWVPSVYGELAGLAKKFRGQVKAKFANVQQRRVFWEEVFQGDVAERALAGQQQEAERLLVEKLSGAEPKSLGEVYLVGAGPGDPDLLTFRALRLMQQADVVLYDRLVAPAILDLCRRDADRIYVGKQRAAHAVPQDQINQLLVTLAKEGKRVLRLKGGDPFIFGRGGEEIEELAAHDVPFQVVPGITAASGCAAYAGIPLTHRDHAQSVRFVTGHLKDGSCDLPWSELVAPSQTLVFYMGLVGLPVICQQLIAHGRAADTPAALVQQGTTVNQRVFTGTLADLAERVASEQVQAPTLVIVGEVVQLREKLAWFEGAQNRDR
ncbi:siroheme synthase CysG [Pseudomonas sp. 9Ag]|uniref:siroheme synthase CysG n=1 Tax=Pseudomonas sp. 9Ag TaxID=2653167 RepID=UPI0012F2D15D|nr:siroheme synthase CysG [Pseudomonas sp. 9Ag]VXC63220.1 fused siroheme synthase 1,3-dimethyluroporphyriongen III dehydrogenase and siroheme ferrochelatase; uroporphyrinogen methyltransferase [Pseudomonas sp. 9Ag]